MKNLTIAGLFVVAFLAGCCWLVMSAAGIQWGTEDAGWVVGMSVIFTVIAGPLAVAGVADALDSAK